MRKMSTLQKSTPLFGFLALALALVWVVGLDNANASEAAPIEEAPALVAAQDDERAVTDAVSGTEASGTWTFLTRESCYDLFVASCTSSFPSPQCPPNVAGTSCSPKRSRCWDTISAGTVDLYVCR
jgi:hypothetical protein